MASSWTTLVKFTWPYPAESVSLKTSLDNWTQELKLSRSPHDNLFRIIAVAPEGVFTYKYIVDDEWRCDPSYPTMTDENRNENNYGVIFREGADPLAPATMSWSASASSVTVFGSWDDWSEGIDLEKGEAGGFYGAGKQSAGVYQFKFLVDGVWRVNENLPTACDSAGNVNNVVEVPCKLQCFKPKFYKDHIEFKKWDKSSEFVLAFDYVMTVVGSWDNWTTPVRFGRNLDGEFQYIPFLPPGMYQFKLFDGLDWCINPKFPTTMDEDGNVNNVVTVQPFHREYFC